MIKEDTSSLSSSATINSQKRRHKAQTLYSPLLHPRTNAASGPGGSGAANSPFIPGHSLSSSALPLLASTPSSSASSSPRTSNSPTSSCSSSPQVSPLHSPASSPLPSPSSNRYHFSSTPANSPTSTPLSLSATSSRSSSPLSSPLSSSSSEIASKNNIPEGQATDLESSTDNELDTPKKEETESYKKAVQQAIKMFNETKKPVKAIKFLIDQKELSENPVDVASFLHKHNGILDKEQLGSLLAEK